MLKLLQNKKGKKNLGYPPHELYLVSQQFSRVFNPQFAHVIGLHFLHLNQNSKFWVT